MSDKSKVVKGESYFAKVYDAVPDFNEKKSPGTGKYQWEINVAVEPEVYEEFKAAGFKQIGVRKDWCFRNGYFLDVIEFQFLNQLK